MNRSGLLVLVVAAGCTPPVSSTSGYVLLDRDAREAGVELEAAGWRGAPPLPLALGPDEAVAIVSHGGRVPLQLRPGALAWVRGGAVEWHAYGGEARADRLIVDGSDGAVRSLADLLGATAGVRDDGRWLVAGPELYERATFLPVPDGIRDVLPDLDAAPIAATSGPAAVPIDPAPSSAGGLRAPSITELVGVYASEQRMLVLDTDGGFTVSDACGGNVERGRYRRDEGRVILTPAIADDAALSYELDEHGALRDAAGERFTAVGDEVSK